MKPFEQQWTSAAFPLALLLVLAGLTFWLKRAVEMPELPPSGKFRHDPDYIVNDMQAKKLDKEGFLRYQLEAEEMRHYPDDDTTEVTKPSLLWLAPERPPMTVTSMHGLIIGQGEKVVLNEQVVIHREASPTHEELVAYMPDLTIFPNDEQAFTDSLVEIYQGKSTLTGVGMHIDQLNQVYSLNAQVSGMIEKSEQKK